MHTVSQQHAPKLPPRSQHEPRRSKLLAFLPGHPVVMDVCVTHPLAASAVAAAAWTTGETTEAKHALKQDGYSHIGTGACRFVQVLVCCETYGRAGPDALALLDEIAEYAECAAGIGAVTKTLLMHNEMRDL